MAGGRPTKYTPELVQKAKDYLAGWEAMDQVIPSIEGLAVHLKINRSTIYEWADDEEKAEFSDILSEILAKQGQTLINKGLTGDFTSTISKLILTKHGYHDKQDIEHGGDVAIKHQGLSRASEILAEFGGSGQDDDAKGDVPL